MKPVLLILNTTDIYKCFHYSILTAFFPIDVFCCLLIQIIRQYQKLLQVLIDKAEEHQRNYNSVVKATEFMKLFGVKRFDLFWPYHDVNNYVIKNSCKFTFYIYFYLFDFLILLHFIFKDWFTQK